MSNITTTNTQSPNVRDSMNAWIDWKVWVDGTKWAVIPKL